MDVKLRKATRNELDWINQRYDEVSFVHSHFDREMIAIAEVGGVRAGLGRLVFIDDQNLELGGIVVLESYRGLGVATRIVEFLVEGVPKNTNVFCIPFANLYEFYRRFNFERCSVPYDVPSVVLSKYRWCLQKYPQETLLLQLNR